MAARTRLITLDTETTGLNANKGDRIIEIGCVALDGRVMKSMPENHLQLFVNPEREVPEEAVAIHGITTEFLADKPKFAEIADQFLDFVRDSTLVIHNAAFDTGFLNMELARLGRGAIEDYCNVIDTVKLAKKLLPGRAVSLDALCRYYEIDNSNRTLHGALLDAELLAEVYIALTRGQDTLTLVNEDIDNLPPMPKYEDCVVIRATPEELAEHERILDICEKKSKSTPAWRKLGAPAEETAEKTAAGV
ncbi:DNA polymerase III subunit epsilon [uncultured Sutterella sp.]|uniref:DNA polymerase III subunit epsilon n=1 Tax=uncultured Sutterella sp. TaxID=286133 RepID=UPI0025E45F14|nr:DNA polymerase III subunit epsilon [uncultured Sutterella sp.]